MTGHGSNVNACKALHGGYPRASQVREMDLPISDVGIEQLQDFAVKIEAESEEGCGLEHFLTTGILEYADHYVVIVPTHVVQNPVATVGMGDTISVSCYAMEVIGTDT